MDGVLLVNKEKGLTSRDVVNELCKKFNTKKIGHTGTLDPMAKGVLVVAINKGLKIVDELTMLDKEYIAQVTLGIETDTLDITGNILNKRKPKYIEKEKIKQVLESFKGRYDMQVPKYSAIKVNGRKLYEYARNNEEVKLPIKQVYINDIKLIDEIIYNEDTIKFNFKCNVSKGTYVRSLIRDICLKLDEIGTMSDLVRTKQGKFKIEDSLKLSQIDQNTKLISLKDSIDIPTIEVNETLYNKIKNGSKLKNIYDENKIGFVFKNELIAIYILDENDNEKIKPKKVIVYE